MTYISDDPALWPLVNWIQIFGYFVVASFAAVIYDWALTFGQEFELVWDNAVDSGQKQRWSFMTVLYICVRYIGILNSFQYPSPNYRYRLWVHLKRRVHKSASFTGFSGTIFWFIQAWTPFIVNAMLGIIMMTRIYAMYQRSKMMLIFLLIVFLASTIASGVMTAIGNIGTSGEESILSGYHSCFVIINTNEINLNSETFIPTAIWEILAFSLAIWIVIKHVRELRQSPTRSTMRDCFMVLAQSHVLYFLAFAAVSCFDLGLLSPNIINSISVGDDIYGGVLQIAQVLQMFVLGPRLILSVREYHAKLLASSDEETSMTAIVFEELRHVSSGGGGDVLLELSAPPIYVQNLQNGQNLSQSRQSRGWYDFLHDGLSIIYYK
ncbi:hypothetical protein EV702DRAFT_1044735 [Suillus placidus]|uniref:DUF6533 domain-containing protein n=1 Tax=Suillus placidus TaxID=48579 RepID=A0A9P6ZXK6_9AGAM|nr:hypothetical protein EV702DRAFT_1051369 [Suillus placidus]KAG1778025.1 hypothetical protein EV702DRAFT_1044735 [Suillus placidus]